MTFVHKIIQGFRSSDLQEALSAEKAEKEVILESLAEGVIVVDGSLHVKYLNFAASKMLGFPKRHLIGKALRAEEGTLLGKCRSLLFTAQEREAVVTDSYSHLDLIASPKPKGKGTILVLQDQTSHHRVLEMGKDFVANASHELRTPITIIRGFAETLQDLPEISPEMLIDITEKIVRNCERMDKLVKNLLMLADLENLPRSRFHSCDLIALIESCRDLLVSLHPEIKFQVIRNSDHILTSCDLTLLELAIMNLLENAVKYSKSPAEITVSLNDLGGEIKMEIADRGIGIPPHDLTKVFDRFYTVDKAHSRRLGGAGLGLSLVKTIIEKHDGSISVDSKLDEGTTFTVVLPAIS